MATTEILPFATDAGANVVPQADYAASDYQLDGFIIGIADPQKLNKVWRQSSFMAAVLANFIVGQGRDVPDDGDVAAAVINMATALTSFVAATSGAFYAYAGDPNGHVAGVAGVAGTSPPSLCEDTTTGHIWLCITSGNAAAAVWRDVAPDASTAIRGLVQLASAAETAAGIDANKAVTPATLLASQSGALPRDFFVGQF